MSPAGYRGGSAPLWVVKLGGSLWRSDALPHWLACLSDGAANGRRLCVVPGGGLFADAVRMAQRRWSFSDEAAHGMAMLGMRQYGLMLQAMCTAMSAWSDDEPGSWRPGTIPVWLPSSGVSGWPDLPGNWDMTSDSLALRLAARLEAERLWLVKTPSPASGPAPADLVDQGFADQRQRFAAGMPVHWLGAGDHDLFRRYTEGAPLPFPLLNPSPPPFD